MAKRKSKPFKIDSGAAEAAPVVSASEAKLPADNKVNVSLRYFDSSFECFSKWQKAELKAFSAFVGKMKQKTVSQVTSTTKTCHAHVGKTKSLPSELSPDLKVYGIDVGSKGRVHGVFSGSSFFLVWLDRDHTILKG